MTAARLHSLFASTEQQPACKGLQAGHTHFNVSESESGLVTFYAFQGSKEQGRVATSTLLQEMTPGQARELAVGLELVADAIERNA